MPTEQTDDMPPYYRALSLRNFRGFKKSDNIPLAPLTFLVGPNSSGKSSIFDALLLLTQSEFAPGRSEMQVPNWGGPLVDLGSYKDTVYKHNTNLSIEIGIEVSPNFVPSRDYYYGQSVNQPMGISYALRTPKNDPIGYLSEMQITDLLSGQNVTLRYEKSKVTMELLGLKRTWSSKQLRPISHVSRWISDEIEVAIKRQAKYLKGQKSAWLRILRFIPAYRFLLLIRESERVSSGRAAPKRWYSVAERRFQLGLESGPRVFDAVDPYGLDDTFHYYPSKRRRPRLKQTLASVLDELEIGNQIHDTKLSPYHLGINVRDSITGVISNLIDIGYGASQVIPILKACLSNAEGPLFVEQPEIHLHPKAQGTIADLLSNTSRYRQVVVETHSVHMINRARIAIARGELSASHVIVNYVERKRDGSHVIPIPILANGDFGVDWPEGFFDERYEDTMLLLKLKSQRED